MLALLAVPAAALLTIQTAKVDITPSEPLPLGGYTERGNKLSEPGGDRLYARCVLLSQGSVKIAVVSAEMLTIPESLYREVAARIPSDIRLFLSATHTHSAPDSQILNERSTLNIPGIANFRPRWLDWYAGKVAGSVTLAARSTEARMGKFVSTQAAVSVNRGRRELAKPDPLLTVVGDPFPLFSHYSAHAVIYGPSNLKLRGDWPGALATYNELGAVAELRVQPVLLGAIGDVSPAVDRGTEEERLIEMTTAFGVSQTHAKRVTTGVVPISWATVGIPLRPTRAHPDFAKTNGIPNALAQDIVSRFAPPAASISAFRIGKLAVVGIPGEPTSILGRQIVTYGKKLGFNPVLVVSHVNGWMGYILDPNDYDRGGYEATLSFYGREQGNKVVESAKTALAKLRSK